jgi:hypothetical protein
VLMPVGWHVPSNGVIGLGAPEEPSLRLGMDEGAPRATVFSVGVERRVRLRRQAHILQRIQKQPACDGAEFRVA